MAYPSNYSRLYNFTRDQNNGLESPAPSKVDAELNNIQLALQQTIDRLRQITSADGRLQNVALAIAQSLVGTWVGTVPATPIITTIPYDSTITNLSTIVLVSGVVLSPSTYTVTNSGGFVAVTPTPYPSLGAAVTVWAFQPGAGLLTDLASTAFGEGASMIGLNDAGNLVAATDVEGGIAEVAGSLLALQTALGDLADYFLRDGSVAATGNFDLDGAYKIINAIDGVDPGDYVTVRQITNYIAAWTDLSSFFMKRDGTTAMAGNFNFGNNKGINLADPDLLSPLDAVNVRSMLRTIATSGAAPVGTVVDFIGNTPPASWLFCDGSAYLSTAYPVLDGIMPSAYKSGNAQGAQAAYYPALVSGNLTAGVLTSLPAFTNPGVGYTAVPHIDVVNMDGGAAVTSQPTWTTSVSSTTLDGPNVSGGVITNAILTGGTGIRAGAVIRIFNITEATFGTTNAPAIAQLPIGYFRTPDLRGRVSVGAGTESKTPGISDPPDVGKGDAYNATPRTVGQQGGAQTGVGAHTHAMFANQQLATSSGINVTANTPVAATGTTAVDFAYSMKSATITPVTLGITGSSGTSDTMPPFHVLNKIIKAA